MRTDNRRNAKRATALVILLCFVMAALICKVFILTHADHDHDRLGAGGECFLCAQMHSIEKLLRQFGAASGSVLVGLTGSLAAVALLLCALSVWFSSPIRLKTRLNN